MNVCKPDMEKYCSGQEYTLEAVACLSEWRAVSTLSDENADGQTESCRDLMTTLTTKKEEPVREKSEEEIKKQLKRKRTREKAAKMSRKQQGIPEKKEKKRSMDEKQGRKKDKIKVNRKNGDL